MDPTDRTISLAAKAGLTSKPITEPMVLRIVEGPDRGLELWIDDSKPTRLMVGRSSTCELMLKDEAVSARHLTLELVNGRVFLEDQDSTNGTRVNGTPIVRVPLVGGEQIEFGSNRGEIILGSTLTQRPPPAALPEATSFGRVVGGSREMRRLYNVLARLASTDVPILIEGETGTGKEVLAEAIHDASPRAKGEFVVFDCTTVAASLVESALFGHERGAFTGATERKIGLLEQATNGTLLIDEIGDLDLSLQPKLLRALERQEFRRVGGTKTYKADFRLLSATRRNLDKEIQEGRFRDDLFHRLAVTRVELPPLRARKGDIPLLVNSFVRAMRGDPALFDEQLLARWERSDWPGNVRELRNAVARRLALGDLGDAFEDLSPQERMVRDPVHIDQLVADLAARTLAEGLPLHEVRERVNEALEAQYVDHLLRESDGNVTRAAQTMGITRRHLHRMLARHATTAR
jgi:DNA-binding NtrC family response regulator